MFKKWGALLFALILAAVLAFMGVTPPSVKTSTAPTETFSAERAMEDVRIIAANPHPTGSKENEEVRTYLSQRLDMLGAEVEVSQHVMEGRPLDRLNRWSGQNKTSQDIFNVIGIVSGEDSTKPALLLMAHHDTVWDSPGAADDTIGIAAIFEIMRALKEDEKQSRDLIILFTDAEEVGLVGAKHFFNSHPLSERIGAVINFEARGSGGTANMFQTSADNGALAKFYARHVSQPTTSSLSTYVYNALPNDTDLTPALEKDYVAYNIANIGGAEHYHAPNIVASALDVQTLQHLGSQGLDLTRALLSADSLPGKSPDATFFDVFGLFTLVYAPFWGWIFLIIGGVFFCLSVKSQSPRKDYLYGTLKMLGFIFVGGILIFAINKLSVIGGADNYYDRLAAIPKLNLTVALLCFATFFFIFGRGGSSENERFGMAVPIFILGIFGQAIAPTATYFMSLALFFCGGQAFLNRRFANHHITRFMTLIIGGLISAYMLVLAHQLMLGVGPDLPSVVILPMAILALSIQPLYADMSRRRSYSLAAICLGLAVILALWIGLDSLPPTVPQYSIS